MKCPHCTAALRATAYEGMYIHTCNGCGGEFVGPAELSSIVKKREQVFGPHLKALFDDHKPAFGRPVGEDDRDLRCPACAGHMTMINYAGDTGVAIDRCDDCGGVWLDHEELERVQLVMEHWQDRAPKKLTEIAAELEHARRRAAEMSSSRFAASRFSFVNALMNRLLDAA